MFQQPYEFLIIPGWQGSGPDHWQSYWEKSLQPSSRLSVSSWTYPQPHDWIQRINDQIQLASSPVILIAHSLGCIALTKWASQADQQLIKKVKAALLVAPADVERAHCPAEIACFEPIPLSTLPFTSLVIGSSNDPSASEGRVRSFAKSWGSHCIILNNAGHINTASGHNQWSEGFKYLNELTKQQVAA